MKERCTASIDCGPPTNRSPAWPWVFGGLRSSIWSAVRNRCRTKTASLDRLQRRNLQLPDLRPPARRRRPHVSAPHSDTETIVHLYEDEGPDCFRASERHVRHRHLGRAAAAPGARPRSARQKAAGLSPRSRADCCSPANSRACCEVPGVPREHRPARLDEYLDLSVRPASQHDLPRHSQAAAGPLRGLARRAS